MIDIEQQISLYIHEKIVYRRHVADIVWIRVVC